MHASCVNTGGEKIYVHPYLGSVRAAAKLCANAFEAARFAPGVRARAVETVRECCEDEDEEEEEEEMAEREPVAV